MNDDFSLSNWRPPRNESPSAPPIIPQLAAPAREPLPRKPFPGMWQAVGMMGLAFGTIVLLSMPVGMFDAILKTTISRHPFTLGVINALGIGLACAIGLWLTRAPFAEVFPLRRLKTRWLFALLLFSAGLHIVLSELDNQTRRMIDPSPWMQKIFEDILGPAAPLWASVFLVVIVAPLSEEFFFRGLILRGFLARYKPSTAIVVSALLFGAFHLNFAQGIAATALGIAYGWWFLNTRSLTPCILGHAVNNGLALIASRNTSLEIPGYTRPFIDGAPQFQPWWFNLTGVALTLAGGLWLYRAFATEKANRPLSQSPPAP
jgi:membrane protease YdiL (CAAX protease family)